MYRTDVTQRKTTTNREENLLSALENSKNGFVANGMYEYQSTFMMDNNRTYTLYCFIQLCLIVQRY